MLQQVSPEQLAENLSRAERVPLVFVVLTVVASLVTRAARWQVYFLPDRRVPFRPLLSTLSISYMASTFLPFRAGELVRAVFLSQRESLAVPRILGTILIEKLFDFLAIGVMLAAVLVTGSVPPGASLAGQLIVVVIVGGFGFVVALAVWRDPTLRALAFVDRQLPFGLRGRLSLEAIAGHFAEGTDSLRERRLWMPLLFWTAATWLGSILIGWAGTAALNLNPGLAAFVFLSVVTSTGQAVPSSPGYVGVYHAAAVFALTSFGVDQASALAIAVLIHAFTYGVLVVLGLAALWLDGYSMSDLLSGIRGQAPELTSSPAPLAPDP